MSATLSEAAPAATPEPGPPRRRRHRRPLIAAVVVVAAGAGAVALLDPFGGRHPRASIDNGAPTGAATVKRQSLSSRTAVNGTLGYAGRYTIVNQARGTVTWLPGTGREIRRGQVLYRAGGKPVVLLYGRVPSFRALKRGMVGRDVRQLNRNLAALGYARWSIASSSHFSGATARGVKRLQAALKVKRTGKLGLGETVFAPRQLRITKLQATLGTPLAPGAVLGHASSTARRVVVSLDAAQQSNVAPGNRVLITLPTGRSTPGVVTAVGKVATTPSGSSAAKVHVSVTPRDPAATGTLDQAPVQVQIVTAHAANALVVPVDALLALAGGGYAVEAIGAGGAHHLVRVTLGLFDDADGLVAVNGAGLSEGQRIVVPTT